jgi:hypothetical protein
MMAVFSLLLNFREYVMNCGGGRITTTIMMKINPSPAQRNDELEFIELTGIDDYNLDQQLKSEGLRIRAVHNKETVLMLLAQQLPAQLEYQFACTSKLDDAVYERLLGLLDEAIQSGKYSKVRRLSIVRVAFVSLCFHSMSLTQVT